MRRSDLRELFSYTVCSKVVFLLIARTTTPNQHTHMHWRPTLQSTSPFTASLSLQKTRSRCPLASRDTTPRHLCSKNAVLSTHKRSPVSLSITQTNLQKPKIKPRYQALIQKHKADARHDASMIIIRSLSLAVAALFVEQVAILGDGELLVVVYRDIHAAVRVRHLTLRVVEL